MRSRIIQNWVKLHLGSRRCRGGDSCCTESQPCGRNEGDCDSDRDCRGRLQCGIDNCRGRRFDDTDDCCEAPSTGNRFGLKYSVFYLGGGRDELFIQVEGAGVMEFSMLAAGSVKYMHPTADFGSFFFLLLFIT